MIPYIISGDVISLVINNKPITIDKYHLKFQEIKDAIKQSDWDTVERLSTETVATTIQQQDGLMVDIDKGTVSYKDYQLPNVLVNKILEMVKHNFDLSHLLKFIDNLFLNPSYKTIQELYSFLEVGNLPITEDGHFLAYKKVNSNFTSIHDGITKNDIGTIVSMARSNVDDNSNNTCSTGLHFCSYDYLKHFGNSESKIVIVKINPKDVVSVPIDYNNTKGRACEYFVLSEIDKVNMDLPMVETREIGYNESDYHLGYSHGNTKKDSIKTTLEYIDGYKDGKNHKKKRRF